jgi:hypothetical protein
MNEMIGVAVYLVLALVVAVGIRAAKAGSGNKPNPVAAPARSRVVARAKTVEQVQSRKPNAKPEHALPWVIPTATAPAAPYIEKKKAPTTVEAISRRLDAIEARLGGAALGKQNYV